MPFSIRKIGKNKYQVYNTATGEIHSKGTTKKKAEGQFRLLQGIARKEVIGLEGGTRGLRGEADPMGDRSIRSHINQYIDPRESLINMIVRLRDHYLNNPPQHESPQRVQITPEILQNPDPIYEHLDERYDHYRDRVLSTNTGGLPREDWDKIVWWVAGTHDDTGIWGSDWTGRQELETYSPHELRYILTRLGVKPINGRPTERTDEIVGSQLSRMEFNAYDPVKEYLEAEAERSDDDDAPDQSHWEDVFNTEIQGLGRRRLKGGKKWNFSNRSYNPLTLGYNALLNGMTENYRSDITKEGVRQDVDRNIEQVKKFAKNPNPITFAKNEAEGQFSRYGSGYPANPSDYQPRRFL